MLMTYLADWIKSSITMFADDTKLWTTYHFWCGRQAEVTGRSQ